MTKVQIFDPKGLMKDAFAIEGISAPECRSIFLDWALGLTSDHHTSDQVRALLSMYEDEVPADHPMLVTLHAALADSAPAKRRGGRQRRLKHLAKASSDRDPTRNSNGTD
jgi:hypothetical protein